MIGTGSPTSHLSMSERDSIQFEPIAMDRL
jgi:hypothetical protein